MDSRCPDDNVHCDGDLARHLRLLQPHVQRYLLRLPWHDCILSVPRSIPLPPPLPSPPSGLFCYLLVLMFVSRKCRARTTPQEFKWICRLLPVLLPLASRYLFHYYFYSSSFSFFFFFLLLLLYLTLFFLLFPSFL